MKHKMGDISWVWSGWYEKVQLNIGIEKLNTKIDPVSLVEILFFIDVYHQTLK